MRTEKEMYSLFNHIACADERIRAMTLEGSRVNPSVTPDLMQDYDITFLVTETESFLSSDDWLSAFGDLIFMQKPEVMDLFPPDMPEGWFSYLMLFADGTKIDLTLVPLADHARYFASDSLIKVLLDKDGICPQLSEPTDELFWIQRPPESHVRDCSNEFHFTATYAARALLRKELLFANNIMDHILREELYRMLGYLAGARNGFPLNTGKRNKWLPRFLTDGEYRLLLATYNTAGIEAAWAALEAAMSLFETAAAEVCKTLQYAPLADTAVIRNYIRTLKKIMHQAD